MTPQQLEAAKADLREYIHKRHADQVPELTVDNYFQTLINEMATNTRTPSYYVLEAENEVLRDLIIRIKKELWNTPPCPLKDTLRDIIKRNNR